jgi:large subunit ribosomal protein L24
MKIKKGDKVLIIRGKDRGKSGKVMRVFPKKSMVIVENLNLRKKTVKPRRAGEKGQIVTIPWPIRAANVMLVCPSCSRTVRVGYRFEGNKKLRYCKKCQATL